MTPAETPVAITLKVSRSLGWCELAHLERRGIHVVRTDAQHGAYGRCLKRLGCCIVSLPPAPGLPDSVLVEAAEVHGCLHLKSAVTRVAPEAILLIREWVDQSMFSGFDRIEIEPTEPFASNGLPLGGALIYLEAFLRTAGRLRERSIRLELLDLSGRAKAEGAVTCCSRTLAD